MKKPIATFLLLGGILGPTIAFFQKDTFWLWVGVVCLIILIVLLVDD